MFSCPKFACALKDSMKVSSVAVMVVSPDSALTEEQSAMATIMRTTSAGRVPLIRNPCYFF